MRAIESEKYGSYSYARPSLVGFDAELEAETIAVEAGFSRENGQRREVGRVEDSVNEGSRLQAPADHSHGTVKPRCGDDFNGLRKERTLKSYARG